MKTLLVIEIFFIVSMLMLTGCGRGTTGTPQDHGEFEPYFQTFEEQSKAHGRDTFGDGSITIEFVQKLSMESNEIGQCDKGPFGRRVLILEPAWKKATDETRTVLMAHELGHCLLNREHDPATHYLYIPWVVMDPYAPNSIMHATLPDDPEYEYATDAYWTELFN